MIITMQVLLKQKDVKPHAEYSYMTTECSDFFGESRIKKVTRCIGFCCSTKSKQWVVNVPTSKLKNLPYIRVLGWKGTVALMTWEIFPHTSTTAAPNTTTNEHEGNSTSMDDCHRCCCKSSQRSNWIHSRELWRHHFIKIWPSDQSPRTPGGLSWRFCQQEGFETSSKDYHLPPTGKM